MNFLTVFGKQKFSGKVSFPFTAMRTQVFFFFKTNKPESIALLDILETFHAKDEKGQSFCSPKLNLANFEKCIFLKLGRNLP